MLLLLFVRLAFSAVMLLHRLSILYLVHHLYHLHHSSSTLFCFHAFFLFLFLFHFTFALFSFIFNRARSLFNKNFIVSIYFISTTTSNYLFIIRSFVEAPFVLPLDFAQIIIVSTFFLSFFFLFSLFYSSSSILCFYYF